MNERITNFLTKRITANDFPSAVYLIAEKGKIVYQNSVGFAVVEPERISAKIDTIYDLASLTKVLVTGLLASRLIERSEIDIEDLVSEHLPDFALQKKSEISVRNLATHDSGFAAWKPFYLFADDFLTGIAKKEQLPFSFERINRFVIEQIANEPTVASLGTQVLYSDLNFLTLGFLVERIVGIPLHHYFTTECISKLGLLRTFLGGQPALRNEIAANEVGNEYERQTCVEKFPELQIPQSALRSHLIWGEVHDGNAYFMGGVAGHAGLFSTAEEVFKIALQFLPEYTQLLKPETCQLFRTNFTKGMNEDRSFAFQLASTVGSTAGTKMSPESFGHNGFTGTSIWIDPVRDRIFVLLTNRTHNHPLPFVNINSVRRRFHDLAIEELDRR